MLHTQDGLLYDISTEQIKQLQITGSFVKFLQSCHSLQMQQVGKKWLVSVKN